MRAEYSRNVSAYGGEVDDEALDLALAEGTRRLADARAEMERAVRLHPDELRAGIDSDNDPAVVRGPADLSDFRYAFGGYLGVEVNFFSDEELHAALTSQTGEGCVSPVG